VTTLLSALHGWAVTHGRPVTPTRTYILHTGGFPVGAIIGIVIAVLVILVLLAMLGPWGGGYMRRRRTVVESGRPVGTPAAGRTEVYEDEVV
jgi:hypothetical protein